MKILLYTGYRTGSNSFGEWASIEMNLPYYHEPFNKNITFSSVIANKISPHKNFSIDEVGDCIMKISPFDGFDYKNLKKQFDKRIVLYRENTKEQAESILWANEKKLWHHTYLDDEFISAYYTIPIDWLNKNAEEIKTLSDSLIKVNELLKSLTDCLQITYEELYYSEEGIKKIENYLGFKSKSRFNKIHKLRNGFIKKSLT